MSGPYKERIPADLQPVAARLTEHRADVDQLQLDEMKQRVLARSRSGGRSSTWLGARLAAILTALTLALGAGGAVALSGVDSHSNTYGGASGAMYKKHKHHCYKHGKPHRCPIHQKGKHGKKGKHGVKGEHVCKKNGKPHKCPDHHNQGKHNK